MAFLAPNSPSNPEVSIIVPLHEDGERFRRCLRACLAMTVEASFEIVIVSDGPVSNLPPEMVHAMTSSPTPTSPAVKRDVGERVARGRILAFLDDDAYPSSNWLDTALDVLTTFGAHAVGGPGLTPPGSSWRERLGGAVYESRLGSGPLRYRFVPGAFVSECDDLPAYNLIARRDAINAVGGWTSTFYGGEDTKVCLQLSAAGFKLLYHPAVVVYHHRRPVLRPHLRQVGNVGRHRGFFVRRYPATSRRPIYFLPALGTFLAAPVAVALAMGFRASPKITGTLVLGGWLVLSGSAASKLRFAALAFPGVLLSHHLAYGFNFVRGFFSSQLDGFRRSSPLHSADW
jgi:glycosyltransferase involved in cell wall biosynthesis